MSRDPIGSNNSTVENDSSSTIENNSTVENDNSSTIENDQGLLYGLCSAKG